MNMHINHLQNNQESASKASTVLWVPSEKVVVHQIPKPKAPKRKWLELIAWQLEDRLLQRVEELHFVIIGDNNDNFLDVLVVSKQVMHDWLALADNTPIQHFSFIPDFLAVPWEKGSIGVIQRDSLLLVRTGPSSGFAASPAHAWSLIESLMEGSSEQVHLSAALPEKMIPEVLRAKTHYHTHQVDWQLAKPVPSANLLIGEFKQQHSATGGYKKWAFAALILICLAFGFKFINAPDHNEAENRNVQANTPASLALPLRENSPNSQQTSAPVVRAESAPRMQVNAQLLGTVITPAASYATIKVNGQPEKVFHIGDEIKQGQTVSEIMPDRITIEGKGQEVEILLSKHEGLISQGQAKNSTSPGNSQDGFALANMFAAVPVQIENYDSGLKLDSLSEEMRMLSDIQEGDVVVQIGNNGIQELMSNPTLWANYSTNTELSVTVIRGGEELALIVNASSLSAKIIPSLAKELIP